MLLLYSCTTNNTCFLLLTSLRKRTKQRLYYVGSAGLTALDDVAQQLFLTSPFSRFALLFKPFHEPVSLSERSLLVSLRISRVNVDAQLV